MLQMKFLLGTDGSRESSTRSQVPVVWLGNQALHYSAFIMVRVGEICKKWPKFAAICKSCATWKILETSAVLENGVSEGH